jgi:hypothetical protein
MRHFLGLVGEAATAAVNRKSPQAEATVRKGVNDIAGS